MFDKYIIDYYNEKLRIQNCLGRFCLTGLNLTKTNKFNAT